MIFSSNYFRYLPKDSDITPNLISSISPGVNLVIISYGIHSRIFLGNSSKNFVLDISRIQPVFCQVESQKLTQRSSEIPLKMLSDIFQESPL